MFGFEVGWDGEVVGLLVIVEDGPALGESGGPEIGVAGGNGDVLGNKKLMESEEFCSEDRVERAVAEWMEEG